MAEDRGSELADLLGSIEATVARLRGLEQLHVSEWGRDQRDLLRIRLEELTLEAKRILEAFGTRCGYCRTAPTEMVGQCVKCGQDACTHCATAYKGVILHRGTCAAFYDGETG